MVTMMARGDESSLSRGRKAAVAAEPNDVPAEVPNETKLRSPLTMATLQKIREGPHQGSSRKKPEASVMHFDNTDRGYGWLLPGWIAEERRMPSGRVYRYYYDPSGNQYRTQSEVLYAWEQSGMVCIDV